MARLSRIVCDCCEREYDEKTPYASTVFLGRNDERGEYHPDRLAHDNNITADLCDECTQVINNSIQASVAALRARWKRA